MNPLGKRLLLKIECTLFLPSSLTRVAILLFTVTAGLNLLFLTVTAINGDANIESTQPHTTDSTLINDPFYYDMADEHAGFGLGHQNVNARYHIGSTAGTGITAPATDKWNDHIALVNSCLDDSFDKWQAEGNASGNMNWLAGNNGPVAGTQVAWQSSLSWDKLESDTHQVHLVLAAPGSTVPGRWNEIEIADLSGLNINFNDNDAGGLKQEVWRLFSH